MANENPNPLDGVAADPARSEILLASNIADDDLSWVGRFDARELHKLFLAPTAWVASLAALPDWIDARTGEPAPAPTLTRDFGIVVAPHGDEDQGGRFTVRSISGTNVVAVVANRAGAIRSLLETGSVAEAVAARLGRDVAGARAMSDPELASAGGDPFAPFWEAVSLDAEGRKKPLQVDVSLPISRFFAHFEILDRRDSPEERARRTASFLLASAFDPEGEAAMYGGLPQTTLYVDRGARGEPGEPLSLRPGSVSSRFYASVAGEADSASEAGGMAAVNCSFRDGQYVPANPPAPGGYGVILDGAVKRWGVEE